MADWEHVIVDPAKLRDYCLNPEHPRGKHKARVFQTALGITTDNADLLQQALIDAVQKQPSSLQPADYDAYGQRYILDFNLTTAHGTASIRSIWIVRTGENQLRLTTCYVK